MGNIGKMVEEIRMEYGVSKDPVLNSIVLALSWGSNIGGIDRIDNLEFRTAKRDFSVSIPYYDHGEKGIVPIDTTFWAKANPEGYSTSDYIDSAKKL